MYETLLRLHPVTLETMPGLACRWAIGADRRTFYFEIDARSRWPDGKPVTAHLQVQETHH